MAEIKLKKSLKGTADGNRMYDSYILGKGNLLFRAHTNYLCINIFNITKTYTSLRNHFPSFHTFCTHHMINFHTV